MKVERNAFSYGAVLAPLAAIVIVALAAAPSYACQFVDIDAAMQHAQVLAYKIWIITAIVAAPIAYADIVAKRASRALLAAILILVFNPAWIADNYYGPDCEFENVFWSKCALYFTLLLTALRFYRVARHLIVRHALRRAP